MALTGGGAYETAWGRSFVRSVRAARRRLDSSRARRVFGPRVTVPGHAPRPLPGARPCAERVGFAVRAWTTGAEIVGTREPGVGGYAPAAVGLQCLAIIARHWRPTAAGA